MRFLRYALLPLTLAVLGQAQTIPFTLTSNISGNSVAFQNGGPLTFSSPNGQTQTAQITATFTGTGTVTISQQPNVTGSSAFTATFGSALPLTVSPGNSFTILVQFVPASGVTSNATLSAGFTQTAPATGANAPVVTTGAITAALTGTAPAFTESYTLQSNQNTVALAAGGAIVFPPTAVGSTAQAALNALNSGSGPGQVTNVTISGTAFRLSNVPLIPATVAAGGTFTVQIVYTPTAVSSDTGQVTLSFSTGSPVTFGLQGNGSSASFTYQILQTPPLAVTPGGTIPLPDTNVGSTSSVVVRVINSGNASGTVSLVSVSGAPFTVSGLLPLPQTLAPSGSLTFTLTFAPTTPGALTGTLLVNTDSFTLTGNGLGSQLQFSYTAGSATVTLGGTNNSVVFSPIPITQTEQLIFDVKNTGTLPANLSSIGIGQNPSPFSVSNSPGLPITLAPGADFKFTITFTPTALGFSTGTLLLDTTSVNLSGNGLQPPPLPAYTISGPSGTTPAMSQPVIGLTLASAYPVAVSGTLTLGVSGNLPADANAQFISGGRVVSFVIPAGQTAANFNGQGTQLGLQTGTVASTFTLTPDFITQIGLVELTPKPASTLQFTVAGGAPTVLAVQVANVTATSFSLDVTGFSTSRAIQQLNVQFNLEPGFSMPTTQFAFNVQPIGSVWFASAASQAFGGEFTMTVPFTFLGTAPSGKTLLSSIASVAVTLTNAAGTSNSVQANLQ
jgi:Abnormal spindle-like microcephaly-assoc'd, ASPM-SPD-2-Hydin